MTSITSTKDEVVQRLCMICTEIQHYKHKYETPADCFCSKSEVVDDQYRFDMDIVQYIEDAVHAKLLVDKMTK